MGSRLFARLRDYVAFRRGAWPAPVPDPTSPDHVRWAFRLLLDREFDDPNGLDFWVEANPSAAELRRSILLSDEFRLKNADFAPAFPRRLVVLGEIESGLRIYVDLADTAIGRGVLEGRYECQERAWLVAQAQPGDVVLDIGANIGYFTLLLAARVGGRGHVLAYEPAADNADLIARSVEANGQAAIVTLRRAAVGTASGDLALAFLPEEQRTNSGGAFLLASGAKPPLGHRTARVPVVALDEEEMPGRVALVKIDVEGAEPQVVRGGRRLFARDRPKVLAELNPNALRRAGSQPADFLSLMRDLGYEAYRLHEGLHPLDPDVRDERSFSVVFLPRP